MSDQTDDWMNPPTSVGWNFTPPQPGEVEYLIERRRATMVSGPSAYIYSWGLWSKHDTSAARDAELTKLRTAHPVWQLRARDAHPWLERQGLFSVGDAPNE